MANLSKVVMPKWGMEMTEGELVEWHIAVGDNVATDADIVDVETAKIVNTVTTNSAGIIVRLCAAIGDVVPVGGVLAVVADEAASEDEIDAFLGTAGASAAAAPAEPAPAAAADPAPAPAAAAQAVPGENSGVSSVAARVAAEHGIDASALGGTGRHGRVSLEDVKRAAADSGKALNLQKALDTSVNEADDSDVAASPVARRLAQELGINLRECRATGRLGRVSKADVEAVAIRRGMASATVAAPASAPTAKSSTVQGSGLTGMRRAIAQRVQQSKQEVPHFRVNIEVDVAAAMRLRKQLNGRDDSVKISLNDILIKAAASALQYHPNLNARFDGTNLELVDDANISAAIAVDSGLFMPVVSEANQKGLRAISENMADLVERAKGGQLTTADLDGGSFSISNLGMFGIDSFDAIISQPQVAILAVGTAAARPVVVDGELVIGQTMHLSLSSDHRVVDGAEAARFMADLKTFIEHPASMLG